MKSHLNPRLRSRFPSTAMFHTARYMKTPTIGRQLISHVELATFFDGRFTVTGTIRANPLPADWARVTTTGVSFARPAPRS